MNRIHRIALPLLSFTALFGCIHSQPATVPAKPPEVLVTLPVSKEITNYEEFTGHTEAVASVDIRARVSGYLDKANFKEGMEVKKGDVLFEIDPRPYQATLNEAKADLESKKAAANRAEALYKRTLSLVPTHVASPEDVDKDKGDWEVAKANVGLSEANLMTAQLNLDFTKVTAPIDGRISRRLIDPGNLVKADDTLLTSIVSLDPMYAYFDVDEHTVLEVRHMIREGKVKSAREVEVAFALGLANEEGYPHVGTINFVDNKVDPNTGTLRIRGVLPNPKEILTPGLFVRVRVTVGTPYQAILIPERALGTDQGQKFLYIVNNENVVEYRAVKVGSLNEGLRVIQEGLAPGERVVVSGLQRVKPGLNVEPKMADSKMGEAGVPTAPAPTVTKPEAPSGTPTSTAKTPDTRADTHSGNQSTGK